MKKLFSANAVYWGKVAVLGIVFGFGLQLAQAWTNPNPALPAPGGNLPGPLTTGVGDQAKAGKLRTASTLATDSGNTLVTKDYVDAAAGYVRGGYYGGCWAQLDASFRISATGGVVWPAQNCGTRGTFEKPSCASGFTYVLLSMSQMNTASAPPVMDWAFLNYDSYWSVYACAKQ